MARGRRRKCKCCRRLFVPDPRNLRHQCYCSQPLCRAASKAASQARWLARPQNQDYFRGPGHVARDRLRDVRQNPPLPGSSGPDRQPRSLARSALTARPLPSGSRVHVSPPSNAASRAAASLIRSSRTGERAIPAIGASAPSRLLAQGLAPPTALKDVSIAQILGSKGKTGDFARSPP
jgi:hypothetical protein